jgi:hypothetical protein
MSIVSSPRAAVRPKIDKKSKFLSLDNFRQTRMKNNNQKGRSTKKLTFPAPTTSAS